MTILLLGQSYWPRKNGIAAMMTLLAEGLAEQGHAVDVATEYDPARPSNRRRGVQIHSFRVGGNALTGLRGEVAALRRFVAGGRWDVQHHHACQLWTFDALTDWLPHRTRPVVVTPHGFSGLHHPAWNAYFDRFPGWLAHVDAVTCLSETFEEVPYLRQIGYERYTVVRNGVRVQEFEESVARNLRQEWGIGPRYWLLNVSNHVRGKGHCTLHALARRLPEVAVVNIGNPTFPERLGLGRWGLKSPCYYACAGAQALLPNYRAASGHHRPTVVAAFRQADVFVLPSVREASPVVLLEAMAARRPWVAYDVGNVRELRGGRVVGDEHELVEAVCDLRANPAEARRLGETGADFVRQHHSAGRMLEQYVGVYRQVVRGSSTRWPS